jgi:3-phosphoshikimate 1-carboxyvinyltransferase
MPEIKLLTSINKSISIPADKSISHRALLLSSICQAKTKIKNLLECDDTRATIDCLRGLGLRIREEKDTVIVEGKGRYFPVSNNEVTIDAGESGTTMRILSGLLAAQKFSVRFEAASSLSRRPMQRIIEPLTSMGANIKAKQGKYPPLVISPAKQGIKGINYKLPVASAQVKSAIILAGLYAKGQTTIEEPYQSRDHTERMLKLFKAKIEKVDNKIICSPAQELISPGELSIPSDFSSAANFIVLGLILKNSQILIKGVNINPTRCGLLKVLIRMGAQITLENQRKDNYEPYADIRVRSSQLKATDVAFQEIPAMIDEIPILGVAASFAKGTTVIKGIGELKVKETNRLDSISHNLTEAGFRVSIGTEDEISITGVDKPKASEFKSFSDHRTAMSAIILGLAIGGCFIDQTKCIDKSFPGFISLTNSLFA